MNKLTFNCKTGEVEIIELTAEETAQREAETQAQAEQAIIDSAIPTIEEQKQAEFEIMGINLLIEMGLL